MTKPKPNPDLLRIEQKIDTLTEMIKELQQHLRTPPSQNARRGVTLPRVSIQEKEIDDAD